MGVSGLTGGPELRHQHFTESKEEMGEMYLKATASIEAPLNAKKYTSKRQGFGLNKKKVTRHC